MLSLSHHSPSTMKKRLDQTQSHVSAFPGISEMTCGNDGKGVALHTERRLFEAQCQHRFVHKVDGLH